MRARRTFHLAVLVVAGVVAATLSVPAAVADTSVAVQQALQLLASRGVDAAGVTVQTGTRLYAGPRCPGAGWDCTAAPQVIQVGVGPASTSTASCSTSSCVIVQVGPGLHAAVCAQSASDASPATALSCSIDQTADGAASNSAVVTQTSTQRAVTAQATTQSAAVHQASGQGPNTLLLQQTVSQNITDPATAVTDAQRAEVNHTVQQVSASGPNGAVSQQGITQLEQADAASAGSQDQSAVFVGHVDQASSAQSRTTVKQTERQVMNAPPGSAVAQRQVGPFRCCSDQTGNTRNTFSISQTSTQSANLSSRQQTQDMGAFCRSSGSCTQQLSETLDSVPTALSNVCGAGACSATLTLSCQGLVPCLPVPSLCRPADLGQCPVPPPPPVPSLVPGLARAR